MTQEFTLSRDPAPLVFAHDRFRLILHDATFTYRDTANNAAQTLAIPLITTESLALQADDGRTAVRIDVTDGAAAGLTPGLIIGGDHPLDIGRLSLRFTVEATVNQSHPTRWSFFKNGWQSWTMSRSYRAAERERVPFVRFANLMQDNLRNLSTGKAGVFHSDTYAVLSELESGHHLVVGQAGGFSQLYYVIAQLDPHDAAAPELTLVYDLDGKRMAPGAELALDPTRFFAGDHPNAVLDTYFDAARSPRPLPERLPTGWCSWYHYFTRITAADIDENLEALSKRDVKWSHFVLDDGYMEAVGDWLHPNAKFPDGPKAVAQATRAQGLTPGLWLAPFIALDKSRLYKEHPDWLLRDERGKAVSAGWNPWWNAFGQYYALDTSHPGFRDYLREVVKTAVDDWGFPYLKLDFLYAAALQGHPHDPSLSPAERLRSGLELIRDAAGEEVVLLGCGCPLGPAVGVVDAMRIGPDVAPFWFAKYRYHLTRDPHALCTKLALRSILTRSQMHRRFWLNDPDCVMLRETETKLNEHERMTLANAVVVSGGMYLVSDRLSLLPDAIWKKLDRMEDWVKRCDRGRPWALDLMEREFPELVYNSAGFLALFNFGERPAEKAVDLTPYLGETIAPDAVFEDVWSGERFSLLSRRLDIGALPAHGSRLLRLVD